MSENERHFTPIQCCGHCGNFVVMEIVATHSLVRSYDNLPRDKQARDRGILYELLSCPACENVTLRSLRSPIQSSDEAELDFKTLYPPPYCGSHAGILQPFKSARLAEKAKTRAVMLRRLAVIHECNKVKYRWF